MRNDLCVWLAETLCAAARHVAARSISSREISTGESCADERHHRIDEPQCKKIALQ
jgi:hypothetical protein